MKMLKIWDKFKAYIVHHTQPQRRSRLERYTFTLFLILVIFIIKILFSYYGRETPFLLSSFSIILSAWFGGFGPGILATLLTGLLNNYLFLYPRLSFSGVEGLTTTLIFIIQGLSISIISEAKIQSDLQKNKFLAFAAHELKNPLAVVKGYNDLLSRKAKTFKDKKFLKYLEKADASIAAINRLINELMDISKIESGNFTLKKEKFSIGKQLEKTIKDQRLISDTHRITFKGNSKKIVNGDLNSINQIINNLISNAIKYSPNRKKILVELKNVTGGVIISVTDYGIGISTQYQKRLFKQYYRVPDTKTSGLGIGLYICKTIAELHEGKIWVKSNSGAGSTFYLFLPAK